jgi:hypothetical protein
MAGWAALDRAFLECPHSFRVKRCLGEIREEKHRAARLDSHMFRNCPRNLFDFNGRAVRKVGQKNLLFLMDEESDSFMQGTKPSVRFLSINERINIDGSRHSSRPVGGLRLYPRDRYHNLLAAQRQLCPPVLRGACFQPIGEQFVAQV